MKADLHCPNCECKFEGIVSSAICMASRPHSQRVGHLKVTAFNDEVVKLNLRSVLICRYLWTTVFCAQIVCGCVFGESLPRNVALKKQLQKAEARKAEKNAEN